MLEVLNFEKRYPPTDISVGSHAPFECGRENNNLICHT